MVKMQITQKKLGMHFLLLHVFYLTNKHENAKEEKNPILWKQNSELSVWKNRNKIVNKIRLKYSDSKIFLMRFKMNYLELVDVFLL